MSSPVPDHRAWQSSRQASPDQIWCADAIQAKQLAWPEKKGWMGEVMVGLIARCFNVQPSLDC